MSVLLGLSVLQLTALLAAVFVLAGLGISHFDRKDDDR